MVVVKVVLEVIIVEVEAVEIMIGSCVKVMTAKKAAPGGVK